MSKNSRFKSLGRFVFYLQILVLLGGFFVFQIPQAMGVSGAQEGTWSGTIHITGDCSVAAGKTLTISSGSTVYFDDNYKIDVYGTLTADNVTITRDSGFAGNWIYIRFLNDTSNASSISNSIISYGGSSADSGVIYLQDSEASITSNTISDSASYGIVIKRTTTTGDAYSPTLSGNTIEDNTKSGIYIVANNSKTATPEISGNTIQNNTEYAINLGSHSFPTFPSANTYLGNGYNEVYWDIVRDGTHPDIDIDGTIYDAGIPYFPYMNYEYIRVHSNLTFAEGVIMKFSANQRLIFQDASSCIVNGANGNEAIFTSYRDDSAEAGGNTHGAGAVKGDWQGFEISSSGTSNINYAKFKYGGSVSSKGVLYFSVSTATLQNSNIENSDTHGVYIHNVAEPTISNNTIDTCDDYGIYVYNTVAGTTSAAISGNTVQNCSYGIYLNSQDGIVSPAISGNTLQNNTNHPIYAGKAAYPTFPSVNTYSGNGYEEVQWRGGTDENKAGTVYDPGIPYFLDCSSSILRINAAVTFNAGVVIKINTGDYIQTNGSGSITTQGTTSDYVIFTSYRDDSTEAGGNTHGAGATAGDWKYLSFTNSGVNSSLSYTKVKYSGSSNGAIYQSNGGLSLDHCVISNSQKDGINLNGHNVPTPTLSVTNSTITNCGDDGIHYHDNGWYTGGSSPTISGNTISNNTNYGIHIDASYGTISNNDIYNNNYGMYANHLSATIKPTSFSGNEIYNNTTYGAYNNTVDYGADIDMGNTWWSKNSGPLDDSDDRGSGGLYNPGGTGDRVSDHVDYDPWVAMHTGTMEFRDSGYTTSPTAIYVGETLYLEVVDSDLNTDPGSAQTTSITVTTATSGDSENVTLTEIANDSLYFRGSINTKITSKTNNNGTLETTSSDSSTTTYVDAWDADGNQDQNRQDTINLKMHTGTVAFKNDTYTDDVSSINIGETLYIEVTDADLNTDSGSTENANVTVITTTGGDSETVTLTEISNNSSYFRGSILTKSDPVSIGSGTIEVESTDTATVLYVDAWDADGNQNQNRQDTIDLTAQGGYIPPDVTYTPLITKIEALSPTSLKLYLSLGVEEPVSAYVLIYETTTKKYLSNKGKLIRNERWITYDQEVQVNSLSANTQYIFKFKTINPNGSLTSYSEEKSKYTLANIPNIPSTSNITENSIKLILGDQNNPAYTNYLIIEENTDKYIDNNGNFVDEEIWSTKEEFGGNSGTSLTNLSPDTSYKIKVKARNEERIETDYSQTLSFTTLKEGEKEDREPPGEVSNLSAQVKVKDRKIILTWLNPSDNDFAGVIIKRSTTRYPTDPFSDKTVYDGSKENFADTDTEEGVKYYYTIFTYDTSGNYSKGVNILVTLQEDKEDKDDKDKDDEKDKNGKEDKDKEDKNKPAPEPDLDNDTRQDEELVIKDESTKEESDKSREKESKEEDNLDGSNDNSKRDNYPEEQPPQEEVLPPISISNLVDSFTKEATLLIEETQEIIKTENVQKITDIVTSLGLAVATISGIISALGFDLAVPFTINDLFLSFVRFARSIPVLLGLKKKEKYWGIVYDSYTKRPLDPARVALQDTRGNIIQEKITDLEGRFGFFVGKGTYKIKADKTNYAFPSKKVKSEKDWIHEKVYRGEIFEVAQDSKVVDFSIPMDNKAFDWNEYAKKKIFNYNPFVEALKRIIPSIIFKIGFTFSIIACTLNPAVINIILLGLYILFSFLRKKGLKEKYYGIIYDKKTGKPVPFARIKVSYARLKQHIVNSAVTDALGRYYILVSKGKYYLTVTGETIDGRSVEGDIELETKRGVLNEDLRV